MLEGRVETVRELCRRGVLHVEDGNHGEYRPLKNEFVEDGTPFVRPPDLVAGHVELQSCDKINETARNRVRKGIGRGGDILFTHRATVGRMALMPGNAQEFVANPGVTIWRVLDENVCNRRFLYFWMQSQEFLDQVWAVAGSTDTFPYVSLNQQRELKLRIPELCIQTRIGTLLGSLGDKIDLNRRTNETLEAMSRAIFNDWLVDFGPTRAKVEGREPYLAREIWDLFPSVFDGEDSPRGWSAHPASDFFDFNPPESIRKGTVAPYLDMAALPTLGPVPNPPTKREYKSGAKFRDGDTLFARITPCLENGKTAYVFGLGDDVVGAGSTEFIVIRSRSPVPRSASYLLARDPKFRAHAERSMTGTSGRQRANAEILRQHEITAPADGRLWGALGDLIEPMMNRVIANAYESRTLALTRDLLLPKLMSGEIRLRDAEKVVEAVA